MSLQYRQALSSVRQSSVVHTLQTSSPQKPLGQSKPNFVWNLIGMGKRKFVCAVWVTWPKWPPHPYMVKPVKNLLRNQRANDLGAWYAALGTWAQQSLFKWWPWVDLFTERSNLLPLYSGKMSESHLNLQQMTRVTKGWSWYKILTPRGCLPLSLAIYMYKSMKKLATNVQSDKAFLLTSEFCPQGVVCPSPGYIYMYKSMKKYV